mmetsp:Transcript_129805/g.225594  ORF Transcript_129805/g.225594 Transcript_129805/m.225594 type:complete len:240 (-) Transcript_129805:714-1433(-)
MATWTHSCARASGIEFSYPTDLTRRYPLLSRLTTLKRPSPRRARSRSQKRPSRRLFPQAPRLPPSSLRRPPLLPRQRLPRLRLKHLIDLPRRSRESIALQKMRSRLLFRWVPACRCTGQAAMTLTVSLQKSCFTTLHRAESRCFSSEAKPSASSRRISERSLARQPLPRSKPLKGTPERRLQKLLPIAPSLGMSVPRTQTLLRICRISSGSGKDPSPRKKRSPRRGRRRPRNSQPMVTT